MNQDQAFVQMFAFEALLLANVSKQTGEPNRPLFSTEQSQEQATPKSRLYDQRGSSPFDISPKLARKRFVNAINQTVER